MGDYFCSLIEAPMGGGKTNTVQGLVTDDYVAGIYGIKSPEDKMYPCRPLKIVSDFSSNGLVPGDILVQLECEDERIVKVPEDFETFSTTKIFANYHMYGIRYVYASFNEILTMMEAYNNRPVEEHIMKDSKWVIDEGWLGAESRRGMSPLTIIITEYAQLMRKLNIELFWLTQHARFLDWRIRYIAKRKILTKMNKQTHVCRLLIQNLQEGKEKVVSYYAPTYWRYYDTNEVPPMPQNLIRKARAYA